MITPPYLKPGDKVGIISTAKRATLDEVTVGIELLKSWGLVPQLGKHAFAAHGFYAGTHEQRAEDLQQMLDDEEIKAVFYKGAYGTLRIIDKVYFTAFAKNPKWIVGYSDITIIHQKVHNLGIESLHAVMLQGIPNSNQETIETLRTALFGQHLSYRIPNHASSRITLPVEGILTGGNLSVLYALTDAEWDTADRILFLEDIDEYLYHADRMLTSLSRAGKLSHLKGLLVGGLTQIKESTLPFGSNEFEIVLDHTSEFNYPVYFDFPAGHIPDNRALILGRNIRLETSGNFVTIEFAEKT